MLVCIKHRTSVLGTQADGQTLACSLDHLGDQEQGVDVGFLPICGCSCFWVWDAQKDWAAFKGLQMGCTQASGVGCGFSATVFQTSCAHTKVYLE